MIVSAQHMTGFYQPWFQIKEEFRRITAVHLEQTFLTKLDFYTPKLQSYLKQKAGLQEQKYDPCWIHSFR